MQRTNKELDSKYTPKAGAFSEAAAFLRELVEQGLIDREYALRLSDLAYRNTMISQLHGYPVDDCIV